MAPVTERETGFEDLLKGERVTRKTSTDFDDLLISPAELHFRKAVRDRVEKANESLHKTGAVPGILAREIDALVWLGAVKKTAHGYEAAE